MTEERSGEGRRPVQAALHSLTFTSAHRECFFAAGEVGPGPGRRVLFREGRSLNPNCMPLLTAPCQKLTEDLFALFWSLASRESDD